VGQFDKRYWLEVVVPMTARLSTLDQFLRVTWLECCDHLSAFSGTGRHGATLSSALKVGDVFARQKSIEYVYDFGSSTELVIKRVKSVSPPTKKIVLLTRNEPPAESCEECGAAATSICPDCSLAEGGLFFDQHAQDHECGEERLLPVVNSPRMGVCGYGG
jgi:hypothetical protein